MQDLGWRWGSCPAARRGARLRAGLTPASASNTLSCLLEMLHSKQLRSIKMLIDSNHGIYRGENPGPGKDVHGELDHTPGIREHSQGHQRHFERPPAISACPQFQTSCCPEANDVSGPEADQVRIGTRLVAAIERRHVPQSNRMKILVAMFQRTADTLRAAPTPITEPVMVWVVEHRRDSGGKTKDRATQSRARRIRTTGAWERSLPG
jgi:hypothetical protein